jgi:hypothetical protein
MNRSNTSMCKKRVTFHTIEIIELPMSLGNHPDVSGGPPLTTEWTAQKRTILNIDFFEAYRPARESARGLIISKAHREQLLLEHGFSWDDIQEAANTAATIKKERQETRKAKLVSVKAKKERHARKCGDPSEQRRRNAVHSRQSLSIASSDAYSRDIFYMSCYKISC